VIEMLPTIRAISGRLFAKYPFFCAHICSVLIVTIACYGLILSDPQAYRSRYWIGQLLTMIAGCGIILEILEHVLSPDPVAQKYATALGWVLYWVVGGLVIVYLWTSTALRDNVASLNLERNLRLVQSFLLLTILALIFHRGLGDSRGLKAVRT
jgi:hypothetical protein